MVGLRIRYYDINVKAKILSSSDKVLLMTVLVLRSPSMGGDHITHLRPQHCLHKPLAWRFTWLPVRLY